MTQLIDHARAANGPVHSSSRLTPPLLGSPALLARRARRAPRPLAHFCTCPHARTERCCPVLHCTACLPFRFVICAVYLRFPGPRAIPYLDLCRLADADQLESVRGATRVVCAKGLVFLSRAFYLVRSLFLSTSNIGELAPRPHKQCL